MNRSTIRRILSACLPTDRIREASIERFAARGIELSRHCDGDWYFSDDVSACESCGDVVCNDDLSSVVVSLRRGGSSEEWCESCRDNSSFYDDRNGEQYSSDHFTSVEVDGETLCREAHQDELYEWESDGEYHWEPEDNENGIAGYHDSDRPWERESVSGVVFGLEVETLSPDCATLREMADAADRFDLIAERDGSLDDQLGVEFVGPPMPLADYQRDDRAWPKMLAKLRAMGVKSWQAGKGYGMHVSVNANAMNVLHAAKFVAFINESVKIGECVAGRGETHWAKYRRDLKRSRWISTDAVYGRDAGRRAKKAYLRETDKYQAAAVRGGGRIEVRIFRGTLDTAGMRRNVEYCAAAVEFTRVCLLAELTESNFLAFVDLHRGDYPNLARHLVTKGKLRPEKTARAQLTNAEREAKAKAPREAREAEERESRERAEREAQYIREGDIVRFTATGAARLGNVREGQEAAVYGLDGTWLRVQTQERIDAGQTAIWLAAYTVGYREEVNNCLTRADGSPIVWPPIATDGEDAPDSEDVATAEV